MLTSLHAGSIKHTNVATDVGTARAAGFDGVELQIPKLARYLDAGYSVGSLRDMLDFVSHVEAESERSAGCISRYQSPCYDVCRRPCFRNYSSRG